ncbi:dehydrogenase [Mangrovactinospora gilvigrisea]|uniref:Dehydrogenase n=1 Tax=Mangrovactinospora gilvigrisea TaxID=1428644 RepID=A0A1J7BB97_9ACTN|nr:Gfo/Idh/MocA family oxidoreductase [Mangrovactinospora gilvigrisea]OIV35894.1 dehydrogenase [Mangrovactinospora gilvigrisea]
MTSSAQHRAVVVGTGHRARMYTQALAARAGHRVVALCDPNPARIAFHNQLLADAGEPPALAWSPDEFEAGLAAEHIDEVVVTTVDAEHHRYILAALKAGCRVVTEKPMTTDADKCAEILAAVKETGGELRVGFNYRYNPAHETVYELLRAGAIGDITSVHFEWMLNVRHGADYFRRWHREKDRSGGLMVHKSGHHFDLVNWWLGAAPEQVFGFGRLAFYGRENGERLGLRRDYANASEDPDAAKADPYSIDLAADPTLKSLYLDAQHLDGYHRDRNVFGDGITIEDDMAVLVRYETGASMSYHLTAYSPWEGYRVMFNGTQGRLELEVEENLWAQPHEGAETGPSGATEHGGVLMDNPGGKRILLRRLWEAPREIEIPEGRGSHGGGDPRMLKELFGPIGDGSDDGAAPSAGGGATERDGALALAIGLAANRSFATGQPVATADLFTV